MPCKICDAEFSEILTVKEEMYGLNEYFKYGECQNCGCLQCIDPPTNLESFYPKNYYSFSLKKPSLYKRIRRGFKRKLILLHPNFLSPFIRLWLSDSYSIFWTYRKMGVNTSSSLLDVGAGAGIHVQELRSAGLNSAMGLDPYIDGDITDEKGLVVKKAFLSSIKSKFDFITFHHSFEHILEQEKTLSDAKKILKPEGQILIRIPTVSSEAYRLYKEKWSQLDAPRHLFLHSHKSIQLLAEKIGLKQVDLWCDSTKGQFIFSEQYKLGISLFNKESFEVNKKQKLFTKEQIKAYEMRAIKANSNLDGDQICLIFKHKI